MAQAAEAVKKVATGAAKGTSLFRVVNGLRYFGVGSKVTRSIYKFPESYWIVTRVNLSKDQNHGDAWGRMVWRGRLKLKEEKIGAPLKDEWKLVSTPDYKKFKGDLEVIFAGMPTTESPIPQDN